MKYAETLNKVMKYIAEYITVDTLKVWPIKEEQYFGSPQSYIFDEVLLPIAKVGNIELSKFLEEELEMENIEDFDNESCIIDVYLEEAINNIQNKIITTDKELQKWLNEIIIK